MLVLICGIRKMLECVFTKRELRLLDDLLPESGKQRRRTSKPKSRRSYDPEDQPTTSTSIGKGKDERYRSKQKEKMDIELRGMHNHDFDARRAIMMHPRSTSPDLPH